MKIGRLQRAEDLVVKKRVIFASQGVSGQRLGFDEHIDDVGNSAQNLAAILAVAVRYGVK